MVVDITVFFTILTFVTTLRSYEFEVDNPLNGKDIKIKALDLDGALALDTSKSGGKVKVDGISVANRGWRLTGLVGGMGLPKEVVIRGFKVDKLETKVVEDGERSVSMSRSFRRTISLTRDKKTSNGAAIAGVDG